MLDRVIRLILKPVYLVVTMTVPRSWRVAVLGKGILVGRALSRAARTLHGRAVRVVRGTVNVLTTWRSQLFGCLWVERIVAFVSGIEVWSWCKRCTGVRFLSAFSFV